jgi:hypothetical protein
MQAAAVASVPAFTARYLPGSQEVQASPVLLPVCARNLPDSQDVHTELPAAAFLPTAQAPQAALPLTSRNLPASQGVQTD